MYLRQAVSLPPSLVGIEWDLFLHSHPVQEVELDPAVFTCSVAVLLVPALSVQSRQVHSGDTGLFLGLFARDLRLLRSELGLG